MAIHSFREATSEQANVEVDAAKRSSVFEFGRVIGQSTPMIRMLVEPIAAGEHCVQVEISANFSDSFSGDSTTWCVNAVGSERIGLFIREGANGELTISSDRSGVLEASDALDGSGWEGIHDSFGPDTTIVIPPLEVKATESKFFRLRETPSVEP